MDQPFVAGVMLVQKSNRHARPCAGHPRISGKYQDVDGRDKPGHDEN
jgi:hypothetical protein